MTKIVFYAHKDDKWIRRKAAKDDTLSVLYDTMNELNEKYSMQHWAIPAPHNPNDYPILLEMEKIATKHIKNYINDFYIHDVFAYLEGDRTGLWLLRDTGTHYIQLGDGFRTDFREVYESYLKCNDYYYIIKNEQVKRLYRPKAIEFLNKKLTAAA